jgi:RecA/RadA recombinase
MPRKGGVASDQGDKIKALDLAFSHIERRFGRGSLIRLGAAGTFAEAAVIPTGSLALNAALGVGGIPCGRMTEIYGPEASGKTALALHIIAEAQKAGGIAAFIDAEHALDVVVGSVAALVPKAELEISGGCRHTAHPPYAACACMRNEEDDK